MFLVLTVDQRASRQGDDAVPALLERVERATAPRRPMFRDLPKPVLPMQRTVGDEAQCVLATDDSSLLLTLPAVLRAVHEEGDWWVGIGLGNAELASTSRASRGPAFYAARRAVEGAQLRWASEVGATVEWATSDDVATVRARERWMRLLSADPETRIRTFDDTELAGVTRAHEAAQGALAAYVALLRGRSEAGRDAVRAVEAHRGSQRSAAEHLGISAPALSSRLKVAHWRLEPMVATTLGVCLGALGEELRSYSEGQRA